MYVTNKLLIMTVQQVKLRDYMQGHILLENHRQSTVLSTTVEIPLSHSQDYCQVQSHQGMMLTPGVSTLLHTSRLHLIMERRSLTVSGGVDNTTTTLWYLVRFDIGGHFSNFL